MGESRVGVREQEPVGRVMERGGEDDAVEACRSVGCGDAA